MLTDRPVRAARPVHRPGPRRRRHDDAPATHEIFARFHGLPPGRERDVLCEELLEAWLPMAHRIAGRFRGKGEAVEDLQQIAALGLLKAIQGYDPRRGAFESYAVPTVTGELRRHFRDHTWDVHVPRRVQDLRNTVRRAYRELSLRPGSPEPTVAQLARHTGLSEQAVREGQRALTSYRALSLDAEPAREDGLSLVDTLGAADPSYDIVVDRLAARAGIQHLPRRERTVLYLRFFEGLTQSRIAERIGVSQMQVCRLIAQTCSRVREEAADGAADQEEEQEGAGNQRAV
ncbi:SigB/SigF/SigG family RNA polymerase sigma factor [Streptomyces cavernicola]|uniref:SigB/SigF/SigG family RNA polymerase sigma factor n=1 Tax=Streptomyces cavernicola TaxID=3043613 RepID=A0ABT6SM29_9ACTN|nr:SigB/SigF/SigG family RNA polymerase sigma factor [Streptomyces sp. B-S-A6]MDI3409240.1 SigB/SigF/SigG family RNA polymerase sigma factor [Streptomyces sp. B-S-A6]